MFDFFIGVAIWLSGAFIGWSIGRRHRTPKLPSLHEIQFESKNSMIKATVRGEVWWSTLLDLSRNTACWWKEGSMEKKFFGEFERNLTYQWSVYGMKKAFSHVEPLPPPPEKPKKKVEEVN